MRFARPREPRLIVENLRRGERKRALRHVLLPPPESLFELPALRLGKRKRRLGIFVEYEPEGFRKKRHYILEFDVFPTARESFGSRIERLARALLGVEAVYVRIVRRTCKAHGKPSRLVVSGDDDERVARVFAGEFERDFHGVVEVRDLRHHGRRIVGVAHPVDFAAFHHYKKPLVIVQKLDCLFGEIRNSRGVPRVQIVRKRAVRAGSDHLSAPGFQGGEGVHILADDLVPLPFRNFVNVALVRFRLFVVELGYPTAPEKVEAGVDEVEPQIIIVAPAAVVPVKRCGGCVVEGDARENTDFPAGIARDLRD